MGRLGLFCLGGMIRMPKHIYAKPLHLQMCPEESPGAARLSSSSLIHEWSRIIVAPVKESFSTALQGWWVTQDNGKSAWTDLENRVLCPEWQQGETPPSIVVKLFSKYNTFTPVLIFPRLLRWTNHRCTLRQELVAAWAQQVSCGSSPDHPTGLSVRRATIDEVN